MFHDVSQMDTLLWVCRGLHLFAVVVWFGGLFYQSVVTLPLAKAEATEGAVETLRRLRRFMPFLWMSAWTMLVTGAALMLFNRRFVFFEYRDAWSVVLGLKQAVFLLMVTASFAYGRMVALALQCAERGEEGGDRPLAVLRLQQYHRVIVAFGIIAILLAASLT